MTAIVGPTDQSCHENAPKRYVYRFGGGVHDGGKGTDLDGMAAIGLPASPGAASGAIVFDAARITAVREMILADSAKGRRAVLEKQ